MDAPTFNVKETQEEVMLHELDLHLNIKAFPLFLSLNMLVVYIVCYCFQIACAWIKKCLKII